MNDSSENVEKENVGDLTWAADDSDFSDKSTTMLVDDDDSVWSHSVIIPFYGYRPKANFYFLKFSLYHL